MNYLKYPNNLSQSLARTRCVFKYAIVFCLVTSGPLYPQQASPSTTTTTQNKAYSSNMVTKMLTLGPTP